MTCHAAREQFSLLLDDALAPPEREALDAHLAACAECRRELAGLRGTVALFGRLPPVHAPAGFVDRVMVEAYRPSWPRRLLDALFRPLRVKLPLEAAAVVLIGVSALYVYRHAPEVQQVARQDGRESSPSPAVAPPTPAAPPAVRAAGEQPGFGGQGAEETQVEQGAAREEARLAPPAAHLPTPPAPPAPTAQRGNVQEAPAAESETLSAPRSAPRVKSEAAKEAQVERRPDTGGATGGPSAAGEAVQTAEPSSSRDAAGARARPAPAPAETGAPPGLSPSREAPATRTPAAPASPQTAPSSAAPPVPAPEGTLSTAKSRAAARLMRAVDASGRLTVPAREPAEAALDALLGRLGAVRVARRVEGAEGMVLIDVVVAGARYRELVEGLARIGRWVTEYEAQALPAEVRVEVALTGEP